jgi:hypothetical protein
MFKTKLFQGLLPIAAIIAIAAVPASASVIGIALPNEILFTGVCGDCAGDALAVLTLKTSNTAGASLTGSNFVSFSYFGTNLVNPFTIDNGDPGFFVSGNLPAALPDTANITIEGDGYTFVSQLSGTWSVSVPLQLVAADNGLSSAYTGAPEPATMALVGLGLTAVVFAGRWRRVSHSLAA